MLPRPMNPKVSLNASSRLRAPDFALWAEGEADNEPAPNLLIPRGQQPGATGRLPCRGGCLVRGQNTDAVTVIQSTDWRRSYSDLQSSPAVLLARISTAVTSEPRWLVQRVSRSPHGLRRNTHIDLLRIRLIPSRDCDADRALLKTEEMIASCGGHVSALKGAPPKIILEGAKRRDLPGKGCRSID